MVSAFASEAGIVLGQVKTQKNLTKSQLFLNYSSGAIVTIDAMGCQKAIAQKIVNKGGDYKYACVQQKRLTSPTKAKVLSSCVNLLVGVMTF